MPTTLAYIVTDKKKKKTLFFKKIFKNITAVTCFLFFLKLILTLVYQNNLKLI
jgi:hypothetical protein